MYICTYILEMGDCENESMIIVCADMYHVNNYKFRFYSIIKLIYFICRVSTVEK